MTPPSYDGRHVRGADQPVAAAGSSSSRRARWRSGSPASRSCPSRRASTRHAGSLVHRALELAFARPAAERTPTPRVAALDAAATSSAPIPTSPTSRLDDGAGRRVRRRVPARSSSATCAMEDPRPSARSGSSCGSRRPSAALALRGIIDRLELARRRARRHRLQDRPGAVASTGSSNEPRRRALLLVPVRAGARPAAGRASG